MVLMVSHSIEKLSRRSQYPDNYLLYNNFYHRSGGDVFAVSVHFFKIIHDGKFADFLLAGSLFATIFNFVDSVGVVSRKRHFPYHPLRDKRGQADAKPLRPSLTKGLGDGRCREDG
jgi:hypothetical protein